MRLPLASTLGRIPAFALALCAALLLVGPALGYVTGAGSGLGMWNIGDAAAYVVGISTETTASNCTTSSPVNGSYGTKIIVQGVTKYACNGAPGAAGPAGADGITAWSSTKTYQPGDLVNRNGVDYTCSACSGGTTLDPALENGRWSVIRGNTPTVWNANTHYFAGDIVVASDGLDYVVKPGLSTWLNDPTTDNGNHWTPLTSSKPWIGGGGCQLPSGTNTRYIGIGSVWGASGASVACTTVEGQAGSITGAATYGTFRCSLSASWGGNPVTFTLRGGATGTCTISGGGTSSSSTGTFTYTAGSVIDVQVSTISTSTNVPLAYWGLS